MTEWFKENWTALMLATWVGALTFLILHLFHHGAANDPTNDKLIDWALASYSTVSGALLLFLRGNKQPPSPPAAPSGSPSSPVSPSA
jgi:hypothetical protein